MICVSCDNLQVTIRLNEQRTILELEGDLATILDFQASTSPDGLREQLRRLSNDDGFAWLREIVSQSLDEFVHDGLPEIDLHAYPAWTIEENLDECGRLLNNTLDLRSEILSLEAQAIQAALDLELAMQAAVYDEEIGELSLSAAYMQAGEAIPGGASPVKKRANVFGAARVTQLALHNQPGSALNYGQRVKFLRSLYLDNVRMAYERMYSIWIGHRCAFGENLGAPPAWGGGADSLAKLVHWMRNAAYRTTRSQGKERRKEVLISVRSKFYQGIDRGYIVIWN